MTFDLADLPLEFRPRKSAPTAVFGLVILLEIGFAAIFVTISGWPLRAYYTTGLISTLSFLFMVGGCLWGLVQVQRRTDHVRIDEAGLTVQLQGVTRRWAWPEMGRFHLVTVHARTKLRMIAIEPRGGGTFDARANVIWPRFGPSSDELLALLRAGKARWGSE